MTFVQNNKRREDEKGNISKRFHYGLKFQGPCTKENHDLAWSSRKFSRLPENAGFFGVQSERSVDNVDEELDVLGVGEVARHSLKHTGDQPKQSKVY